MVGPDRVRLLLVDVGLDDARCYANTSLRSADCDRAAMSFAVEAREEVFR